MTVQSEISRNDYIGNGATATYTYGFRIFAATDLLVTRVTTAGVETTLAYPADYSVTGVGSFSGGTITLTAGVLTTGYGLTIRFSSPLTQGIDIRNQGGFFPEVVEDALDRLTKLDQQQQDELDRSVKLPETEIGMMRLPTVTERANRFLGFDSTGSPIAGTTLTSAVPATAFGESFISSATAGAAVETTRTGLAAETVPASDDEVLLRDTSAATGKRMALSNLMKVITVLTAETAPDALDQIALYDDSAATADKVTLSVLAEAIRGLLTAKSGSAAAANYSLAATVAANALTLTLSAVDATALSATNAAHFTFRAETATTGTPTTVAATANLSLTISSGSTLGASSGVPHRLWVVVFNDAGTLRLGAIACATAGAIFALADDIRTSSTAEGGAGGADSAGIIYTGAAVTTKALRVIGYIESTQATAGTWVTAPSKIQLWQVGMKLPGDVVQRIETTSSAYVSAAVIIPADNTIPQNTEGTELLTATLSPTSGANFLSVVAKAWLVNNVAGRAIIALFRDTTASAIAAGLVTPSGDILPVEARTRVNAAATTSTTFKLRYGPEGASTIFVNGSTAAALFGGTLVSGLFVEELMS